MLVEQGATDGELVEAVRAGDDSAFEELYRRYKRRIGAFVYGYVRDEGRAEDVTQEAFMSALRRMRETDSEIAFRPWIYEIARNAAIDLHRRQSRAQEVSISGEAELPPGDKLRLVGLAAPESALVDKERIEHLRGALDELSESHHRILVLRELEGLSYREIASRMDLTAPAVESTLFRARRRLEQEYSELDTGRRCRSMRSVIARLAEGVELPRERSKLERHATRCSRCRRQARELGVEPMRRERVGVASRAAAFLPLPALLRRHVGNGSFAGASGPAVEGAGFLGKAGALLAAAALAGGGGATLGGYGPLAPPSVEERQAAPAAPKSAKRHVRKESSSSERRASGSSDTQAGGAKRSPRPGVGSHAIKRQPATATVRRPAPPVIPPETPNETLPAVPLNHSQSTGAFSMPEVVVPDPIEPVPAAPQPVAAVAEATSSAAPSSSAAPPAQLPPAG